MTIDPEDMLDYHLGQMEDDRRRVVEAHLAADPTAFERSRRLGGALGLLLDDAMAVEPRADMMARTMELVRASGRSPARREWAPMRLPMRWADAAVAAAMLLAGLGTLVPALLRTRMNAVTAACAGNLHQVGVGLASYANAKGHYPQPIDNLPVGTYGIELSEAGFVPDPKLLTCPASAIKPRVTLPSIAEFTALHQRDPKGSDAIVHDMYPYQGGFRRENSRPEALPATLAAVRPLVADCPPLDDAGRTKDGNSRAHGGGGQNVLFSDNHVEFRNDRRFLPMDEDIYRNANKQTGLGLHVRDVSLLPAVHRIESE